FLAVDAQGEKEMARTLLADARQSGVDVSVVEPELSAPAVVGLNLKVPPLTSVVKGLLNPDNWLVSKLAEGQAVRGPLGMLGSTTPNGQLLLERAAEPAGKLAVVYRRRIEGNFSCR